MSTAPTEASGQTVLVVGHRNPDTDAVCSALAYAFFYQWQTGETAIACYLDDLAPETTWLFQHLKLAAPRPITDVYLRVAEVMETHTPSLHPEQTIREAGLLMRDHEVGALPVVDQNEHLIGILRRETLADRYLDQLQLSPEVNLPVALLQRTLEATLVAGDRAAILNDHVLIATMTAAAAQEMIDAGDIVIVGGQSDLQLAAVTARAGCLIVTQDAPIPSEVVTAAQANNTVLLRTHHSPFAAALLIQQSTPLSRLMEREPASAHADDLLTEAQALLRRSRLASLPVVGDDDLLRGLLFRRHILAQNRRRVILTDHNHPDQTAPGVTESEIVAIVDHHNLGGLQTLQPLTILCEPVGCTCTLIAELFQQRGAPLTPALAGAMLAAILSDTVHFRSPTTTPRDRAAVAWLEQQSGEQAAPFARALFRARLPDPVPPPSWWVGSNWKAYTFGDQEIGIGQIELTDVESVMPPKADLRRELQATVRERGLTTAFLMLTDILEERTLLLAADAIGEGLATRAFGHAFVDDQLELPGVMSRKKQVLPPLAAALTTA
ncbi:MAG: putative manganese-dependent inorganic diphosphatase [Herpetosiphonaceae bacterium]|nr:putative manganese-dependent inorganic diphosphatase [Herpetosiphonaceae bacterium]